MAAYVYIATPDDLNHAVDTAPHILFEDSAEYWFLYRYFESANLDPRHELFDLYDGATLSGYQLDRLLAELYNAEHDAQSRDQEWPILVGWNGDRDQKNEIWLNVSRQKVLGHIATLRRMIQTVKEKGYVIVSRGD